jgi:hypothetical protein
MKLATFVNKYTLPVKPAPTVIRKKKEAIEEKIKKNVPFVRKSKPRA